MARIDHHERTRALRPTGTPRTPALNARWPRHTPARNARSPRPGKPSAPSPWPHRHDKGSANEPQRYRSPAPCRIPERSSHPHLPYKSIILDSYKTIARACPNRHHPFIATTRRSPHIVLVQCRTIPFPADRRKESVLSAQTRTYVLSTICKWVTTPQRSPHFLQEEGLAIH